MVILSARKLDFADSEGKEIKGISVMYCEDLNIYDNKQDKKGIEIFKAFLPYSTFSSFISVPGHYEPTYRYVSSKGKRIQELSSVEFIGELEVS